MTDGASKKTNALRRNKAKKEKITLQRTLTAFTADVHSTALIVLD